LLCCVLAGLDGVAELAGLDVVVDPVAGVA
jgi:hypothetical protein